MFETEADLSAAVYSVASRHPGSFTGSADHLVSKAFYFTDPEGNGVELYWDRARTEWSWTHSRVEMATMRLDPTSYLNEHLDETAVQQAPHHEHLDQRRSRTTPTRAMALGLVRIELPTHDDLGALGERLNHHRHHDPRRRPNHHLRRPVAEPDRGVPHRLTAAGVYRLPRCPARAG